MQYDISNCLFYGNNRLNDFFSLLTESEIENLYAHSFQKSYKKGQLIFKDGDEPAGLIYMQKGSAKVFKFGSGNREQIVRLVKQYSFVGYKALFAGTKHTTNAAAIAESEVIIFKKDHIFSIIHSNPGFSIKIINALATELSFSFERMVTLTQKHIRGRIAETLLLLKDIYGFEEDELTINVEFTRENIAHFSNMTTSNAIRTLRSFEKENLINTKNKRIQLLNIALLNKISKLG